VAPMDDAQLVEAARSGDDTAWAAVYDRYADKLHDHCYRILRDRDEAADALHDAFLAGSRNLHQLRDPSRLRPWLYSICRHSSLRLLKARSRVDLTDAPDDMTAPEPELDRGVRAQELGELVWAAAAGLNGRDQALLDLHLRQGLEGQDLADAMGASLSNSYVMLSRMRDQVERSLGALLIARMGREDCDELDALLQGWDGRFSPLLRKRVARHVDGCEVCSEKRKVVASPLALLAAAPLVPAPALLKARVISSIRNVDGADAPDVPFTREGFAALGRRRGVRPVRAAWLAVAAALLLVLGGAILAAGEGDGDQPVETAALDGAQDDPPTTSGDPSDSSTSTSVDGGVSPIADGGATDLGDVADGGGTDAAGGAGGSTGGFSGPDGPGGGTTGGGTDGGVGEAGGADGGTGGTTTTTSPPATTTTHDGFGPKFDPHRIAVARISCSRTTQTIRITANATDPAGVTAVMLVGGIGDSTNKAMGHAGGDSWTTTITVDAQGGSFTPVVRATDGYGLRTTDNFPNTRVAACPTGTDGGSTTGG
jgi:RNA polymerase sigma factor (sigma-70 family)